MDWKRLVNTGLSRVTGHKLVKAERPAAPPARPPKRRRGIPRHYDEEARQIIRTVKPRTMTSHEKLYALILATRYVVERDISGAVVECGVWRGGSMQAVAHTLLARGITDRELHLFDTFEGMPEPTQRDRLYSGRPASEVLESSERTANVWAVASLDDVRAGMAETGYPRERVHFHPGLVEHLYDRVPQSA
jgi:O-methyltransferase